MQQPVRQLIPVSHSSDVSQVRQVAKMMAESVGFDEKANEEIAIVATELSSNLVEHAGNGTITLTRFSKDGRAGIQIESDDAGPGIADINQAMTDGFSTKRGLGSGLGAVNRLMDEFEIDSHPGEGTHILCRRRVRIASPGTNLTPLEFGAATRPHPMMDVNGDAFVVKQWDESALVAVIDGVGHGPPAFEAARAARQYVETHYEQPFEMIFQNIGYTCRATRGVVMALARFDWRRAKLVFANIGNVEVRVFGSPQPMNFLVRRGVVGYNAPSPIVTEHEWVPQCMMILHTDGVKSTWRLEDFPELTGKSASMTAQGLLHALSRGDDDATVMVVRGGAS